MIEPEYWTTEEPHATNAETMGDWLDNSNMLDITHVDGSYAEGVNAQGQKFGIHASGNGDFCNHKVEFELL